MTMREITFAAALNEAMSEEMRRDENVFFMGEDIGVYGGTFQVSKGMVQEFGPERVMNTPISETAFIGAGIGAAATGMRPIVELMYSDFIAVCYDQIINQAAKMRYMFGPKVKIPLVIRTAHGGGTGAAAQHSQSLEQMCCHVPGLKVIVPSTPYDAKGLLKSAIRDDNCCIFMEPKLLYRTTGMVPEEEYTIPLGVAEVKREGRDLSIITYGRQVLMALEVAEKIKAETGQDIEVLDLRTLSPLDTDAVTATAKKTGKVVVVHEAVEFGGFGGEIVSTIACSDAFHHLRAPIQRVGGMFCPVPFHPALEERALPGPDRIEAAVRKIL